MRCPESHEQEVEAEDRHHRRQLRLVEEGGRRGSDRRRQESEREPHGHVDRECRLCAFIEVTRVSDYEGFADPEPLQQVEERHEREGEGNQSEVLGYQQPGQDRDRQQREQPCSDV